MGLRGMVSVGLYLRIVRVMDEAPCRSENIDVFGEDFLFCLQSLLPRPLNNDRKWYVIFNKITKQEQLFFNEFWFIF